MSVYLSIPLSVLVLFFYFCGFKFLYWTSHPEKLPSVIYWMKYAIEQENLGYGYYDYYKFEKPKWERIVWFSAEIGIFGATSFGVYYSLFFLPKNYYFDSFRFGLAIWASIFLIHWVENNIKYILKKRLQDLELPGKYEYEKNL